MIAKLNGKTRLFMTVGYPIGQVKSPADITRAFKTRNVDAVQVPIEVFPEGIDTFFKGLQFATNLDGMVITVPYKFIGATICRTLTPRAARLGATNVIRRNSDGSWHGDMTDGLGFCNAVRKAGSVIKGKQALLIGAGGAGSAIGLALLEDGLTKLGIYDVDRGRSDSLMRLLADDYESVSVVNSPDPAGYDIVAHATPSGMKSEDPLPLDVGQLTANMHVGDVVTEPEITPLIEASRERGCRTNTGIEMFDGHRGIVVDFLLHQDKRELEK